MNCIPILAALGIAETSFALHSLAQEVNIAKSDCDCRAQRLGQDFSHIQEIIGYRFVACKVTDNQSP